MRQDEVATARGVIRFSLRHAKRRTLAIHVHPDGEVEAVAPLDADPDRVRAHVLARAGWIARQQVFFEGLRPRTPPRRYVSGETHLYLGRRYRLRVDVGPSSVALRGAYFVVTVPQVETKAVAALLRRWYRSRAQERFTQRLREMATALGLPELELPRMQLRRMRMRWGSALASGLITLNPDLVRAAAACSDYVIMHELTHLEHPRHDAAFWRLLTRRMPDWKERKARLEASLC